MKERILLYRQRKLDLATLVADIDFLITALEGLGEAAQGQLRGEWETLEEVHAVTLDQCETAVRDDGRRAIDESLDNLLTLLEDFLSSP